jgi:hypothetical protein
MSEGGRDSRFKILDFRILKGAGILPLLVVSACLAGEVVPLRVGTLEKTSEVVLPIPPLATVLKKDRSGKTWQQTGAMDGALAVVSQDFRQSLLAGGWVLDKTIKVGEGMDRMELAIWTRLRHRVLVMIWEKEPGQCGFSWGEER